MPEPFPDLIQKTLEVVQSTCEINGGGILFHNIVIDNKEKIIFCGISLTDSELMKPIKSVSGIIEVGKQVKWSAYTYSNCEVENCIYRNRKSD